MAAKGAPSNNPNGRPEGSRNQKTLEWEAFGKELIEGGIPRIKQIMQDAKDEQFMDYYAKLIEYFKPKLARTELTGTEGNDITIKVIYEGTDGSPE